VQVNSLGLTEQQAENNVYRILIEMLAVVLSKSARARACSFRLGTRRLACHGLGSAMEPPRPADRRYETDILEFEDIFDGSPVIEAKVTELAELRAPRWTGSPGWAERSRRSSKAT